jgi:hypothetical protein
MATIVMMVAVAVDIMVWYGRAVGVGPRLTVLVLVVVLGPRRRPRPLGAKIWRELKKDLAGKRFVWVFDSKYRPRASAWRWQDGSITMNQSMTELVLPHHDEIGVR